MRCRGLWCLRVETLWLKRWVKIAEYKKLIKMGKVPEFRKGEQGTVWFKNKICVSEITEL
jgi:hypothetical protein